jgi:hypothetical protein
MRGTLDVFDQAVTGAKLVATHLVMAGLVPAIPINLAWCHPDRDRRDKPGDDAMSFAPVMIRLG